MVLVCHSKRLIYLKTQKTAGTSVEMFLQAACSGQTEMPSERTDAVITDDLIVGRRFLPIQEASGIGNLWRNHMTAASVKQELGDESWSSYTKVANVRNPYDIAVSRFYWELQKNGWTLPNSKKAHVSFFRKSCVKHDFPNSYDVVHLGNRFVPSVLLRYETLIQDLRKLCGKLGLVFQPGLLPVTKHTKSNRLGLKLADYYDEQTQNVVRDRFQWLFREAFYPETLPTT